MPARNQPKFQYRCPFPGCGKGIGTNVQPSDYPQCNGSHNKIMDFIEDESREVPRHIRESKQEPATWKTIKKGGGNWYGRSATSEEE